MLPIQGYWKLILSTSVPFYLYFYIKIHHGIDFLGESQKNRISSGVSFKSGVFTSINPFTHWVAHQLSNLIGSPFNLITGSVWASHLLSPTWIWEYPPFSVSTFSKLQSYVANAKKKKSFLPPFVISRNYKYCLSPFCYL